jgi:hypothetical protein
MKTPIAIASFVALLAAPALHAAKPEGDGCFVNAFAGEQFHPPMTTYTGPRHERLFMRHAGSLIVGPHARLLGYAGNRYRKETLDVPPGAHVADLAGTGFDRRVDSFKVVCGDGDRARP